MRWFVEISSLGQNAAAAATLCVEAPQWQPALQQARALRGDDAALSGFSIELLDDGYRAIDPAARLRYIVRRAPDDAALTNGAGAHPGSAAPAPGGSAPRAAAPVSAPVTAPSADAAKPRRAQTVAYASSGAASVTEAQPIAPRDRPSAPRATGSEPSRPAPPTPRRTQEYGSTGPALVHDRGSAPAPIASTPSFQVLAKREEEPSASSPLTYREYVYAVAPGTSEAAATRLLHERFADLKRSLESARAGKFVNLAVFDHVFQGKPQRRPIATLTWKDWRSDEPSIAFPASSGSTSSRPPSAAPTQPTGAAPAAHAETSAPQTAQSGTHATTSQSGTRPIASPAAAPPPPAPSSGARVVPEPAPSPPARVLPPAPPSPPPSPAAQPAPPKPPAPTAHAAPPPPPAPPPASPDPAPQTAASTSAAPISAPPRGPASGPPSGAPDSMPPSSLRFSGDELIAELFEAFADLHFLRDTLEGADFVLSLALEKLPCEAGLVSLFDINRREFVVVHQFGGDRTVLLQRMPERTDPAYGAMRARRAAVIANVSARPDVVDERWRAMGVEPRTLICAPVELGGRYLGLIELANPLDEQEFTKSDGHALTYIGQQFAEFVAARGIVIDPDHVLEYARRRRP